MDSTIDWSFQPVFLILENTENPPSEFREISPIEYQKYESQLVGAYNLTAKQKVFIKSKAIIVEGRQIEIISRKQTPPDGFRVMSIQEGQLYKKQISTLLTTWSIVAFDQGKIDGNGYGNKIHQSVGNECGEKFIISL